MSLERVFRWAVAAQATAMLAQVLLAGLALYGSEAALRAHMTLGAVTLLISAVQVIAAFLLRRREQIPAWLIGASIGLLVADAAQMAAGRLQLFALHLPLGVALFGAAVALAICAWAWRPGQIAESQKARSGRLAVTGVPIEEKA